LCFPPKRHVVDRMKPHRAPASAQTSHTPAPSSACSSSSSSSRSCSCSTETVIQTSSMTDVECQASGVVRQRSASAIDWPAVSGDVYQLYSVRITWKPEYAGPPHLFSLPHRTNAVAENLGTQGAHTYFSVIRLLQL